MLKKNSLQTGLVACVTALTALTAQAAPIQFVEPVVKGVSAELDVATLYPAIAEYGSHNGGVGVEDNRSQPGGQDGNKWFFFQTGNGGHEAGIRINLGQALVIDEGDSLQVSLLLGEKQGQAYTAPISIALTDGPAGRPLAQASYTPVYVDGQDRVSFCFKQGLRTTANPLHVSIAFKQDSPQFVQGLVRDIQVTQGTGLTGDVLVERALSGGVAYDYDGTVWGKEVLTPKPGPEPKLTGATIFGVRPGKPIRYCASAIGEQPVTFSAEGLPEGVHMDPKSGWITGRAPQQKGDVAVVVTALNSKGRDTRTLTLRVGDTICLTPPMGWNSWYVHSEGVSEAAIREMATAMKDQGLQAYGWSYVNIDDCWMGERDPVTKRIQANGKFDDMQTMVEDVNALGLKVGIYSTTWMSTFAGYIGGTAPNEAGDYSEYYLAESERQNPHQVFGRFPSGIEKRICEVGPVWFVDRDAQQFADWGIDYVKYDWLEWDLLTDAEKAAGVQPVRHAREKMEANGITQRFYNDFRALDRDIVVSLSPKHHTAEDTFVQNHSNLWRLTEDIHAHWKRMIAPFEDELVQRLALTRPGAYGDLDMLQIGPLGRPNRAEKEFRPSPLKPAEQYHQVTLWCLLTQPMLLSCNIPTMDEFDLNLVTNHEVLAVNQDALCKQGYRLENEVGTYEIWAKDLEDGSKAVGLFNLSEVDQVLTLSAETLGMKGVVRDLWRQKDVGELDDSFSAKVSAHGVVFIKVTTQKLAEHTSFTPGEIWQDNNGVHINAHGGGVMFHEGTYYWFGEHKVGGHAGNQAQVGVHVYSSQDLYNWKDEGIALEVSEDPQSEIVKGCIIERPKVIYNPKTEKFVMWFHLELKGQGYRAARSGIAIADTPVGPFTYVRSIRPNAGHWPLNVTDAEKDPASIERTQKENEAFSGGPTPKHAQFNILGSHFEGGQMARDMNLFVDDDGKGYHIYSSEHNSTLHISLLTDDFLDHAGTYTRNFPFRWMEAPALFKREGKYYLIASGCTGWEANAARSAVADSILGPWKELENPCVGVNPQNGLGPEKTFGGQSTYVLPVQGKKDAYIALFDIWRAADAIDGRYVWLPVTFENDALQVTWHDEWDLSTFDSLEETLPALQSDKAPQTFEELWEGFDPRAEPLQVEILKEWEEQGVVLQVLRYRVGVFNGEKAMMAAIYGYPKGGTNLPGLVQMHGGGQSASYQAVLTNAKRGYATLSMAWAGRLHAPEYHVHSDVVQLFWDGKTEDPNYLLTTDWGAVDAYHAPCRYKGSDFIRNSPARSEHSLDPIESPRNSGWFLCTIASRRALTFLEQQPEVDPDRLGAYGHSMGGKLTVMLAAADKRVKAAAPSCGGISDKDRNKTPSLILDDVSLQAIDCPIVFLSPSNDFHGHIEHLQLALDTIQSKDWRITCAPHHQHQDTQDYEVATQIWFDQILKHTFETPETPHTKLKLHTRNGVPEISVFPDTSREILSVDVFVTREAHKKPSERFWHHVPAQQSAGKWTANLELYGVDKPLWVYANVRYQLDQSITGAGYYYGVYTTDSFVLSSRMHSITPEELASNRVRSVLTADHQIEDFAQDWQKEWYTYSNDPKNWRMTTRKLGDDLYRAPEFAKLAFSVRAPTANQLLLKLDKLTAVVEVNGGNTWQEVVLQPMDFKDAEGNTRFDWNNIKSLQITDQRSKQWQGDAPEFRSMRWMPGTRAERDALRRVKLLEVPPMDGKTYLDIDHADHFSHGYRAAMNTWLDGTSPLVYQDKTYPQGVTTHADAQAVYFLGGQYKTFRSIAQAGPAATVVFQVFVDDEKVFDSGMMTRSQAEEIDLSVENAMELKLVVTDGGNGNGSDHASWIDAHLQR